MTLPEDGDYIQVTGYLTALRVSNGKQPILYFHGGGRTFRVEAKEVASLLGGGVEDIPLGPRHLLRLRGRIEGSTGLPTLRVEGMGADSRAEAEGGTAGFSGKGFSPAPPPVAGPLRARGAARAAPGRARPTRSKSNRGEGKP